uniref:Reverse transcriptase domain-containing protein n=1 Tax=Amphiprion percula TaxID=161767 RepID=A0A3P8SJP4_AMPPE
MLPSVRKLGLSHRSWVLQQDNDPKHTAKNSQEWLRGNHWTILKWPSTSPDLNHLWKELKHAVWRRHPSNLRQLEQFAHEEWAKISAERCRSLIDSYRNLMGTIIFVQACFMKIFRRIEYETGININGDRLNNLRFADDIILFTESEEQLGRLLNDLNKEGKKDGMKMNKRKTKIMCNEVARRTRRNGISIDGEQLEEVEEYKYLGRMLTPGNEMAREIDERITAGWKRFGQYSSFLKDQKIPMCMKKKIMDTVEDVADHLTELVCTVPEKSRADAIRTHGFPGSGLPELHSHLIHCWCEDRRRRWRWEEVKEVRGRELAGSRSWRPAGQGSG